MNRKMYLLGASLIAAAALTACGGGGGGGYFPPPAGTGTGTTTPPPVATTPPVVSPYDMFISYMLALVQTAVDTAEPADVTAYDPAPTSDTAEPVAVQ